jgi:hypothetical protein
MAMDDNNQAHEPDRVKLTKEIAEYGFVIDFTPDKARMIPVDHRAVVERLRDGKQNLVCEE